ncbi:MAG: dethiobiotin synthase [Burkholderiales bacterium]|nr:dethiobiotin synthase [Burkholderiales bacterium]
MIRGYFITGTDTEVGKTLVTTSLLNVYAGRGFSTIGMKPVAAGATHLSGQPANEDVEAILAASSVEADRKLVNPYFFLPSIAPHIAASDTKKLIDPKHILDCYRQLASLANVVVVEGVGGFRVPLCDGFDTADLVCEMKLPVVLVVGLRLGCINHALLTAEAIEARGIACVGWIANQIDPHMAKPQENIATLDKLLNAPRLAHIEHLTSPTPQLVASQLHLPAALIS